MKISHFSDDKEVGLVYFRAGYDPDHFKSKEVILLNILFF